jgi:energy-coupling factor transporter ATP-binding protein EcfA2
VKIECRAVSFAYDEGGRPVPAIKEVDLVVKAGAAVALLGPSGSGKSTLLMLLRGLLEPDAGVVVLDGAVAADKEYAQRRREIGLVFQEPETQLFASTARDDVAFGPRQLGWPAAAVEAAAEEALAMVGLPASEFGERHPYSLSGGEQRRLALAGVLAMRPRTLLLDEPFVSLDPGARRDLAVVVRRLVEGGMGLVLATHDVDQAWSLCDERLLMVGGGLAAAGDWDFAGAGAELLAAHRLRTPFFVDLWRRLGRPLADAPRTVAAAVEALR